MAWDLAFLEDRIAATEAQIIAYEEAVLAFAANGAQLEYLYDTGQSRLRVERAEPADMQRVIDALYNRHAVLCVRAGKTPKGSFTMRPKC